MRWQKETNKISIWSIFDWTFITENIVSELGRSRITSPRANFYWFSDKNLQNSINSTTVLYKFIRMQTFPILVWFGIGFSFQNFCAIFAERNAKFYFLCASVLREKTTICAIIRKSHFAQNCPIPLLRNSSFAQFHNFVPKSETDCPVKVSTILVLDMHIS